MWWKVKSVGPFCGRNWPAFFQGQMLGMAYWKGRGLAGTPPVGRSLLSPPPLASCLSQQRLPVVTLGFLVQDTETCVGGFSVVSELLAWTLASALIGFLELPSLSWVELPHTFRVYYYLIKLHWCESPTLEIHCCFWWEPFYIDL